MKITKNDQVAIVAQEAGLTLRQARVALDAVVGSVVAGLTLSEDRQVTLHGLGTFSVHRRDARRARNPATGATMDVPAKNVVKFKASKDLRDRVEGAYE